MNIYYTIFVYVVWFLSTFFIFTFLLHAIKYRNKLFNDPILDKNETLSKVSIIVPVFNEGKSVERTINSLKKIEYPKNLVEIIVVNDGSKDNTSTIVRKHVDGKHIIFIDNKINKGKAACLNQGIRRATGVYVACMDGDSRVSSDVLIKTLPFFKNKKTGAVTITVEVDEKKNFLQKVIELEFILGLSLFLKVFSFFNCVFVTPGPFSIYRKTVLDKIGGFDEKNITEDLEIAYRIHKAGYIIENTMNTKVMTLVPKTFKKLYVQRKRWYTGAIITFWQHRNILAKKDMGLFRYFMPFNYSLIFFGIGLFLYSTFLGIKNFIKYIMLYSLTDYNFFSNWTINFDLLSLSIFFYYGVSATILTALFIFIGLKLSGKRLLERKFGMLGYLFLFIFYQLFWLASIVMVALKRKAKWR